MKIWLRLTLLFGILQLVIMLGVGSATIKVVRDTLKEMVAKESRQMVGTLADSAEMLLSSGDDDLDSALHEYVRPLVLNRRIGETGFYFLLHPEGQYLVHPNETVEGKNWKDSHDFINYILSHRSASEGERFIRYVSPKTGEWKQVYFETVEGPEWIICSSAWEHEVYAPIQTVTLILIGVLAAALLLTLLVASSVSRKLGRVLGDIAGSLDKVGRGDLTTDVKIDNWSKETRQASQYLHDAVVVNMRNAVNSVKHSVSESYEVKNDLAAASEQTGAALNQIDANVSSIKKRIDQLGGQIDENAGSISSMSGHFNDVLQQINEQGSMVEEATSSMNEMLSSLKSMANITSQRQESVTELTKNSKKVSTQLDQANRLFTEGVSAKIETIQSAAATIRKIAAQTNLLAMNAAIEAAHAGDAGRGFSVVAEEIRNLSEVSTKSSANIADALKEVVENIKEAGTLFEEVQNSFDTTNTETQATLNAFQEIESSTQELSEGGTEILSAITALQDASSQIKEKTEELSDGVKSILNSEENIRTLSSENLSGIKEISVGVHEVSEAMQAVNELNNKLNEAVDEIESGVAIFKTEEEIEEGKFDLD